MNYTEIDFLNDWIRYNDINEQYGDSSLAGTPKAKRLIEEEQQISERMHTYQDARREERE